MITLVNEQNYPKYENLFERDDPQTLKIRHLMKAHGLETPYCDFYVIEQEAPTGIFCKLENEIVANLYSQTAICDFFEFARFLGANNIMLTCDFENPDFSAFETDFNITSGTVFKRKYTQSSERYDAKSIEIADFIGLVSQSFDDYEKAQTDQDFYSRFYCDISHKVRHGIVKIYGEKDKWCVLRSLGDSDFDILSHIAVSPQMRGQNIGSLAVNEVSQIAQKDIVIYSRNAGTDIFYTKNGFNKTGNWYIIKEKENNDD